MTESPSPIEPPVAPKRRPTLLERLRALWRPEPGPTIQPLFTCSHLYANGTSAWSSCYWAYGSIGWAWYARCARCGRIAPCR